MRARKCGLFLSSTVFCIVVALYVAAEQRYQAKREFGLVKVYWAGSFRYGEIDA
jgi:hypothetical protein